MIIHQPEGTRIALASAFAGWRALASLQHGWIYPHPLDCLWSKCGLMRRADRRGRRDGVPLNHS